MNELVSNLWHFSRSSSSYFSLCFKLDWHWRKRDAVHSGSGTGQ
jgi:hypothetical protein